MTCLYARDTSAAMSVCLNMTSLCVCLRTWLYFTSEYVTLTYRRHCGVVVVCVNKREDIGQRLQLVEHGERSRDRASVFTVNHIIHRRRFINEPIILLLT